MFFSSPSADIQVIFFLLAVSLIVAVATHLLFKKILVSIFAMSLLGNLILYVGIDYNLAKMYDILWLFTFVRNIFPFLNLFLLVFIVILYLKNRYAK
ncbi:MAG: hypothetical protein KA537_00770 [Candidatus Moranbacteria bacterium]|nr:hypothetical protein [Candidatus Moranbacteria bacterium]